MVKYPYQVIYSTKQCTFIRSRYYGWFSADITTNILLYLQDDMNIITKIYSYNPGDFFNCDKLIYFKGVEYIQRAWRKILLQRKEIKDHFKDQVARELMAYCYHPSRLSFQV